MAYTADQLYQLLPAIYRIRDAERGQPLRGLVAVIAEQAAVMEQGIGRLYENWFIETCEEWVVPYIGDLLGVRGLHPVTAATFSHRARVANTLSYRRRKGTASMLEQLARDTMGWPVRVVECFQLLATTQHLNHVRPQNVRTPDLRQTARLDLLSGPFDTIAHTADVRHIDRSRGVHNIMNVATYVWRLQAYPIEQAPAFDHGDGRFSFSQLGHDLPLFTHPVTASTPSHLAEEMNVPAPIRRLALKTSLDSDPKRYYGRDSSFQIWLGPMAVPSVRIVACNLTDWAHRPPAGRIAVDPVLGRIALPIDRPPDLGDVRVDYYYGASSEIGGGGYARSLEDVKFVHYRVGRTAPGMDSIAKAIERWTADGAPNAVVEIQDNGVYEESLHLHIPAETSLTIRASNQRRPVLRLTGPLVIDAPRAGLERSGGGVTLDGLLITGQHVQILAGDLGLIELRHCTLVPGLALASNGIPVAPGEPSIAVARGNERLNVVVTRTICGGLRLPDAGTLTITDSLIDGTGGPAIRAGTLVVRDSTICGAVAAMLIEQASNSIFTGRVKATRMQSGCVRFCYLRSKSNVPRRYRCQPDVAIEQALEAALKTNPHLQTRARARVRAEVTARLFPSFTNAQYGQPAYGQLDARCAVEISTGADDQSELGVFHHLKQQQREANFRASVSEYLGLGLEAGLIHVT